MVVGGWWLVVGVSVLLPTTNYQPPTTNQTTNHQLCLKPRSECC